MKDTTTIKLSRAFKDSITKDMKKNETYEDYIKKFVEKKETKK